MHDLARAPARAQALARQRMKAELLAPAASSGRSLSREPTWVSMSPARHGCVSFLAITHRRHGATVAAHQPLHGRNHRPPSPPGVCWIYQPGASSSMTAAWTGLNRRLAPSRVRFELRDRHRRRPLPPMAPLNPRMVSSCGCWCRALSSRPRSAALPGRFRRARLEVSDPPIEEIIGRCFVRRAVS